ncbi:Fic family protein [Catalinimonas alkaloidigena]|uniref:Fic family protein n=1 Tax=Catalinimonas alkaloidigena TaxID=1075417 RepID=A0A1G9TJ12_9BACT|nr:Fic family protein [Catalinimonas alkaloidigena]SDM47650.1 Fic family protein [Catalinimonas alkaloidigena]
MRYNWQHPDWPIFRYALAPLEEALFRFAEQTGQVTGLLTRVPDHLQLEATIDLMVAEAIKTSAIEGEYLSRPDVVSSVRNNLGLNPTPEAIRDKRAQGAGELMADARRTFADPLTAEKLFAWHTMLLRQERHLHLGAWRTHEEPMQVVSGALGKEKVHFEAPPSSLVPQEMERFIRWFNETAPGGRHEIKRAPVRSAITHLYFESIHPFEDGNGRIGRVLAEKALSQTLGRPVLLSLSRTIEADKASYYAALQKAQQSNEITPWLLYFVDVIVQAQRQTIALIDFVLAKSRFFDRFRSLLNERQRKVVKKMFDAGPEGFEGGMNARKYVSIAKTSKATATRDLQQLLAWGVLVQAGGGRSTHYHLPL